MRIAQHIPSAHSEELDYLRRQLVEAFRSGRTDAYIMACEKMRVLLAVQKQRLLKENVPPKQREIVKISLKQGTGLCSIQAQSGPVQLRQRLDLSKHLREALKKSPVTYAWAATTPSGRWKLYDQAPEQEW